MSILRKLLLGLVVVLVLLVVVGFLLPSSAHVERSTTIEAPQPTVFALVNGFRLFNKWSPWAERDPETQYVYEGPDFGVGAKMSWSSENPQVGSGYQQIVASEPYDLVKNHLDFGPQGVAESYFQLSPVDSGTRATWGFDTDFGNNLIGRYMGLMFEKWLGADYEAGLAKLKALAESLPNVDWSDLDIEVVAVEPVTIAYTSSSSDWDPAAIGQALGGAYGQIGRFMAQNRLQQGGPPLAISTASSEELWEFDAGIPLAESPEVEPDADSPVRVRETYGGEAVRAIYVGPYTGISASWDKVRAYVAAHGLEEGGSPWEEYVSDPGTTPEEELITHLFVPVR